MRLNSFFKNFFKKWKTIVQKEIEKKNIPQKTVFEWIEIKNMDNYIEDNRFTSPKIKEYIFKTYKFVCKIQYEKNILYYFSEKPFQIYLSFNSKVKSTKDIIRMLSIISSLKQIFHRENYEQTVYYFPTPFKKEFPKPDEVIGVHECNSGVTFLYYPSSQNDSNGKIILFREEEHIKVLIHELIHSNYCDETLVSEQEGGSKTCFCSKYPILFHETYTETLATILNIFFIAIIKNQSIKEVEKMLSLERKYSCELSKKIFEFYGIDGIKKVLKNDKNHCSLYFPQQSNVFSYYILKPLLLSNFGEYEEMMAKYTNDGVIVKKGIYETFNKFILSLIDKKTKISNSKNLVLDVKKNSIRMTYHDINKTEK